MENSETDDLSLRLVQIRSAADELKKLPDTWLAPQGSEISDVEWFVLGAVKRTSSLAAGFCAMMEAGNILCAATLIRLQIDTAMRIHGLSLVDDPHMAGSQIMNGLQFNRLHSRNRERLTDSFLHKSLSNEYPSVSSIYKEASDYVHLSGKHLISSIGANIGGMIFLNFNGTSPVRTEVSVHLAGEFLAMAEITAKVVRNFAALHPGPLRRRHGWRDK